MFSTLVSIYFDSLRLGYTIRIIILQFQAEDPKRAMLSFHFLEKGLQILCIIFQEKYFSCYFLLTRQISLSGCLNLLRYWAIWALKFLVSKLIMPKRLKINIEFAIKVFSYMAKWVSSKIWYLKKDLRWNHLNHLR